MAEAQGDRDRSSEFDRERRKLNRVIEEKEAMVQKLKEKMNEMSEKTVGFE